MDGSAARRSGPLGPGLMIVGAAIVLAGCLMPWFKIRADLSSLGEGAPSAKSTTAMGLDTSDGTIFLVIAVAIAVLGVVALVAKARGPRRIVSVVSALGALFVGGFAVYDAMTPETQAIDEAVKGLGAGISVAAARRFFEGLFDRGIIDITVEIGLWIVLTGAVLALVGALIAAATARSFEPVAVDAMPPMPAMPDAGRLSSAPPADTDTDPPITS